MIERAGAARTPLPSGISLLMIATVAISIRAFLIPYARHFRALGWRVDAAANGVSSDAALRDEFDHVYELPLSRSILDLGGIVRGGRGIATILESGPDIVHVHTPIAAFVTRFVVRRMPADRRPAVAYTTHGFHFHQGGRMATNAVFLAAERVAGRWTDRLVVVNDEDYRAAQHNRIVDPSRLVRMPGIGLDTEKYSRSGVDPDDLAHARRELHVGRDTPLFVVVGELNRNKRPDDVIEALAWMHHSEAVLVLVGEGPERARLEALAGRKGLSDRIRFTGFIGDVRPMVGGATALVLPSKREGLSRSIMEALALEVPVVASTARGNRELVDADSGFIVPTGDVRGLAAALDWLVDHPVERLQMGRHGRQRMVEQYDLRNLVRLHEEMYAGMLVAGGARRR
jgi:glycosyltransferase involved in cell wall biosynthesis